MNKKQIAALLIGAALIPALQGCFTLVAAGAATGVLAAIDRRTIGAQTEDETIEWKALSRAREQLGDKAHLNFTSYNRKVLLSGEAISAEIRFQAENIVAKIPNILGVYNEIVVGPPSSFADRSNDAFITSKVKSRSLDNGKFSPARVKVITEAGTTFLLGIVTQEEANAAIDVARTTSGVRKVVNLFEIITLTKARELDKEKDKTADAPADSGTPADQTDGTP
jgi:osmotically-inducible protein OsmY